MEIILNDNELQDVYDLICGELNYKIYESGCASDYESDIKTYLMLLEKFGCTEMANEFRSDYEKYSK